MNGFLKKTAIILSLGFTTLLQAAPTATGLPNQPINPNVPQNPNTKIPLQKQQALNMQNSANSLIQWLNANLVTGTPIDFSQTMKANIQAILSNHDLNDLNWLLTQKITFASLASLNWKDANSQTSNNNNVKMNNAKGNNASGQNLSALNLTVGQVVPNTTMSLNDIKSQVAHFNIGFLLKNRSIQPNSSDERNAQILLGFVSGLNNQVTGLPANIYGRGMGDVDDFQSQFGTYLAQQSVGLNVLYGLLNERLVKPGLGTQLGGPQQNMSPLALEEYMATRRLNVNDPNGWLAQLANASPAQVSKEQLIMMAEMEYELYLMRRTMEQTNMLLATQSLQASNLDADKLQTMKNKIISSGALTGNAPSPQ